MALRSSDFLPCLGFFQKRQIVAGVIALLMQLTVVLWPLAASWARKYDPAEPVKSRSKHDVNAVLNELVRANRAQVDPYARATKKFRQTSSAR